MEDLRGCVEALALAVLDIAEGLQNADDANDTSIIAGRRAAIRERLQYIGGILENDELEQALAETAPDFDPGG